MKVKYYHTSSDRNVIAEFLDTCSEDIKSDFVDAVSLLEGGRNLSLPLSRALFGIHIGLHELRLKDSSGIFRLFYFIKKKNGIHFLHAFKKKKEELSPKEKSIVLKRIKEV